MDEFLAADIPVCKSCGDIARPNILMFGDWHWNAKRAINQEAKYNKWIKQNRLKKKWGEGCLLYKEKIMVE